MKRHTPSLTAGRALVFVVTAASTISASHAAMLSTVLTDVVKSSGVGNINLLKDVTAVQIEAYRLNNSGYLAFAVDVNEAASGTEKADSQAVALKSVVLTATIGGVVHTYAAFTTETKALLAEGASTTRVEHYTLIGDTGSSRITTGNSVADRFDSTLRVEVPDSLAAATAVRLDVVFLTTNVSLGDPEAFYDFSNGFEDMAILTYTDALYLDGLAPGREDAPTVVLTNPPAPDPLQVAAWTYYPSSNGYYLVAYEDKYPNKGDYDFNDLTVAYQVQAGANLDGDIVKIEGVAVLVTRGADYNSDWHLILALPAGTSGTLSRSVRDNPTAPLTTTPTETFSGAVDLLLFEDTRYIFIDQDYDFVNTLAEQAIKRGPKATFSVVLDTPIAATQLAAAPFDPYLYVHNTGYEIHLPGQAATPLSANLREGYTTSKDASGLPFAMIVPDGWLPPLEMTDMGLAYPDLIAYVTSGGKQKPTWYLNPAPGKIKNMTTSDWSW
jgi:LruC domain-containing protein